MTAILDEIRRLEAAERRGEISATEMRVAKADLMDAIEDANAPTPPASKPPDTPPLPANAFWHVIFFCFGLAGFGCAIATLVLGDLTLALTLTLTVLAAFTVHAFRTLDD